VLAVDTVNDPDNRLMDPAPLFTSQDIDFYQVHTSHFSLKICFVFWLARLLSFKRPLLSSTCLSVSLSQTYMLNISETERFRDPIGKCLPRVDW